jgi:hypothetical protein
MDHLAKILLHWLRDRQQIEECVSHYANAVDRHDAALIAGVYHPDARDVHGPFDGGVPEFATWVNALHERKTRAHTHNITTHFCELQDDRAFADTYVMFVLYRREREAVMLGSGRYVDRLERRNGRWKIAERRTIVDMRLEAVAQPLADSPGGYSAGTWDTRDPSYQRPLVLPPHLATRAPALPVRARPAARAVLDGDAAAAALQDYAARRAIRDCIAQSVRGLDRGDRELALRQYAPGAQVDDGAVGGNADFYVDAKLAEFSRADSALTHNLTSHQVEIDGHRAAAETYLTLMRLGRDGMTGWVGGLRLLDRLQSRDGHWRISSRQVVADFEFAANGSSLANEDQYLRSRRDRTDISYERH